MVDELRQEKEIENKNHQSVSKKNGTGQVKQARKALIRETETIAIESR